ncbi:DUF1302 domain-containing protein [Paraburkholderia youngii]|uniref:DUF1302 domain-containing protein n=1 Tax=Paraburkholderia youngii TaxID=2782701 RepID=A0A7W8P891_9BURK|nr:DUF1302 family protein [Paraburkholderia youngii]MBB5403742.1 hypothetical protein [Paraburkholderia youngii]
MKQKSLKPRAISLGVHAACIAAACGLWSANANAFHFDVPNPDIDMQWDNTLRADYGIRLQNPDQFYTSSPTFDEGNLSTPKFSTIQAMLNLYSEFDFKYKETSGFRISMDAWYDPTFKNHNTSNPAFLPNYPNNEYTSYIKKYYQGPSAELRDAFVFNTFDLGGHSVNVKLGRTAITWGQSAFATLGGANSVAIGQQPLDLMKLTQSPSASLKEIVLPTAQAAVTANITDTISLGAQYTFEWNHDRLPEGGTYFGGADPILYGPPIASYETIPGLGTFGIPRIAPTKGQIGDIGLNGKWRVDSLATTYEFTYRHFAMKMPWAAVLLPGAGPQLFPGFNLPGVTAKYGNNVNLIGAGFNSAIGNAAVAGELSYRWNMPLTAVNTTTVNDAPTGRTLHGLLNVTQSFGKTPLWDNMFLQAEFAFNQLLSVTHNAGNFANSSYDTTGQCSASGNNPFNNCSTRFWAGIGIGASPQWYQVFPGVDLTMPLFVNLNLKGYSSVITPAAEAQGQNTFVVGLDFTIYNKHQVNVTYTYYMNKKGYSTAGAATALGAPYSDKSWIGITYQTTF